MPTSQEAVVEELVNSKEVRSHLAFAGTCVAIGPREGSILWASPSCADILGWGPQELVGSNIWRFLFHPEDVAAGGRLAAAMAEGDILAWIRLRTPEGPRRWYRVDALQRKGLVVAAFRRETDVSQHHFHSLPRQG
ncbi:MAG: PAS domain-containing protein [Thermoplasmatota archaeon]